MEFSKEQIKAIFIAFIAILFIVLIFLIISVIIVNSDNDNNTKINVSGVYSSIKELVEHYNCKYKNDTYKKDREYATEVNLVFSKLLYVQEQSNEEFYNKIITDMAKFVGYTNFRMIDTENDIDIKVTCKDGRIYQILINDIEDYFIYMESQYEVTKYEEIASIQLTPNVDALNYLIDTNWASDVNFGSRESIFENYNIYFDEGVKYKKIGSKVYNVIFTNKYINPVVNNINVGTSLSDVEKKLGDPAFEDKELGVIGYKGKDIYAFFTKDTISIYKNKKYDYTEFWKLVDKFIKEDMEFKEFMNQLTDIWPDYNEYIYSSDYMFMSYPNRGIEIKLNYDNVSGIIIYNNIGVDLKTTKKYLENTEFLSRLKLDSVFEAEKRRLSKENELLEICKKNEKESKGNKKLNANSMNFYTYFDKDLNGNTIKVLFKAKNDDYVDRELNEAVNTYFWLTDEFFVYSVIEKGIYAFNCNDGTKIPVVENNTDEFIIKSFEGNILKYDNSEVTLEY